MEGIQCGVWLGAQPSISHCLVEGNLVKALNHCKLENMKKLIKPSLFLELSNIKDKCFHISLGWLLGLW